MKKAKVVKVVMGRPRMGAGEAKTVRFKVRMRPREFEDVKGAARGAGKTVSGWVRERLLGEGS